MNDDASSSRPVTDDVAGEVARLLPPPPVGDLTRGRHLHHRERLMHEIDHDRDQAAAKPGATPSGRRARLLRPALLMPVTALALAGALTAGLALSGDGSGSGNGGGARDTASATEGSGQAGALLGRISKAAMSTEAETVREDQFVYTRSSFREADVTSGKAVTDPLKEREIWLPQRSGPLKKLGLVRQDGESLPINPELGEENGTPAGLHRPTYRWFASLPTDPDALLKYLYAKTSESDTQEHDQVVFDEIRSLVSGQIMPPENAAAFFKAAARIPGVTKAPDARDVTGRKGTGIAREDTEHGERSEWVFDADDLSYLGARTYLTRDTVQGEKGTLLYGEAIHDQAVVDTEGARPTKGS
ncbi:CU044_5270 family protein [Streptomyces daliensis]|uniref:CU044_5270 family protein n=1 Tax=Streptomyces daliensis TaxID=299421 RepID=A0A8T4IW17_9ACTN|nr:CU044_5270 family protein [Streptomyces daliensis]